MISRVCTLINRQLLFLLIYYNTSYYFWMITCMKNVNNRQMTKIQLQGVAQHLLNFFANFILALLIKVLLIKKACRQKPIVMIFFFRSSRLKVFCKKGVIKNSRNYRGKNSCARVSFLIKLQTEASFFKEHDHKCTKNVMY